jgi:hypothetical protein
MVAEAREISVQGEAFRLRVDPAAETLRGVLLRPRCEPAGEDRAQEFHWLAYVGPAVREGRGFSAACELWRWAAGEWRSISVPGARFSPEEMHAQDWRYCGPCVQRFAQVAVGAPRRVSLVQ